MHRGGSSTRIAVAVWLGVALGSAGARAELFRCAGPDGRMVYTDDKSVCPQAKPYQPDGVVHGVDPSPQPEPAAAEGRPARAALRGRAQDAEAGEAQVWRERKRAKEDELRQVAAQRDRLHGYVAWCNRGGQVITRDEAGIKQNVRCNELNDRLAALDEREEQIRDYLENGLAEECRRAGCLPGWIR